MAGKTIKSRKSGERKQRQLLRWGTVMLCFVAVNIVLRLLLLPVNEAEYTDGILQVQQFSLQTGIWPPLYTALVWPFQFIIGPLWGGRLVSTLFSAAAVIPIFLLARRSFGLQAAFFAALIYTFSPISLRWAPRLMTDATFSFFFWFTCERLMGAQGARTKEDANRFLVHSCVLGTLAALTRYQGMMLFPPVIALAFFHHWKHKFIPWKGVASVCLYGLVPLWSFIAGNIHGTQFTERAGGSMAMTALINGEAFLLLMPYFLTYPVAIFALIGLSRGRARPMQWTKPLTFYVLIVLLAAQGAFGSFQERYMLPVAGLLMIWGGVGMAAMDNILRKSPITFHNRLRPYFPIIVVGVSCFYSFLVLFGSRQAFGDLAEGAMLAGQMIEPNATVYTNEVYRQEPLIAGTKVDFFGGVESVYLTPEHYHGYKRLQSGDLLVMSSLYGASQQMPDLNEYYQLTDLTPDGLHSSLLPIFPDLMAIPGTNQSFNAWAYRYTWQPFQTRVYRVEGLR